MADALDEEQADILQLTVAAIGGVDEDENGASVYIKGDECIGTSLWVRAPPSVAEDGARWADCLGDLIRTIKRDDESTPAVLHLLGTWNVLQEHLVPILHTYQTDEMLVRATSTTLAAPLLPSSEPTLTCVRTQSA
jgi:hypothetical protein